MHFPSSKAILSVRHPYVLRTRHAATTTDFMLCSASQFVKAFHKYMYQLAEHETNKLKGHLQQVTCMHMCAGLVADAGSAAKGVSHLIEEWKTGIVVSGTASNPQRTQPIQLLEGQLVTRQVPKEKGWRSGPTMRKVMLDRKPIWLAYERRVLGHPLHTQLVSPGSSQAETAGGSGGAAADAGMQHLGFGISMQRTEAIADLETLAR